MSNSRRKFIRALLPAGAATTVLGADAHQVEIKPGKKYMLFVNANKIDTDALHTYNRPDFDCVIVPLVPRPGHPIADEIAMYETEEK